MKKLGLLEVLEGIEDSRRERSVWYPLHEVLFIFIAAVICGATSYVKVEMFGKSKEQWLKSIYSWKMGYPMPVHSGTSSKQSTPGSYTQCLWSGCGMQ